MYKLVANRQTGHGRCANLVSAMRELQRAGRISNPDVIGRLEIERLIQGFLCTEPGEDLPIPMLFHSYFECIEPGILPGPFRATAAKIAQQRPDAFVKFTMILLQIAREAEPEICPQMLRQIGRQWIIPGAAELPNSELIIRLLKAYMGSVKAGHPNPLDPAYFSDCIEPVRGIISKLLENRLDVIDGVVRYLASDSVTWPLTFTGISEAIPFFIWTAKIMDLEKSVAQLNSRWAPAGNQAGIDERIRVTSAAHGVALETISAEYRGAAVSQLMVAQAFDQMARVTHENAQRQRGVAATLPANAEPVLVPRLTLSEVMANPELLPQMVDQITHIAALRPEEATQTWIALMTALMNANSALLDTHLRELIEAEGLMFDMNFIRSVPLSIVHTRKNLPKWFGVWLSLHLLPTYAALKPVDLTVNHG